MKTVYILSKYHYAWDNPDCHNENARDNDEYSPSLFHYSADRSPNMCCLGFIGHQAYKIKLEDLEYWSSPQCVRTWAAIRENNPFVKGKDRYSTLTDQSLKLNDENMCRNSTDETYFQRMRALRKLMKNHNIKIILVRPRYLHFYPQAVEIENAIKGEITNQTTSK